MGRRERSEGSGIWRDRKPCYGVMGELPLETGPSDVRVEVCGMNDRVGSSLRGRRQVRSEEGPGVSPAGQGRRRP